MGCGRFMCGIDTVICLLGVMVVCSCVGYGDKSLSVTSGNLLDSDMGRIYLPSLEKWRVYGGEIP
jgi:hypothetical protein